MQRGIDFLHEPGPTRKYFFPEIMGSGVALFDADADEDLDIYFLNGCDLSPDRRTSVEHGQFTSPSPNAVNRLFLQGNDGRFKDASSGSGLEDSGYSIGVAVGDVDNDGAPDVYVTRYGEDRLFHNLGDGHFEDVTNAFDGVCRQWGTSACFFDYDRDGLLDLYVAQYVEDSSWRQCFGPDGQREYCEPSDFSAVSDRLFHNETTERAIRFRDVSQSSLISSPARKGLGIVSADFNYDGWPDLYVANDGEPNSLWINARDGTFDDQALVLGSAFDANGRSQASMGIAVGDFDADRRLDLFVTHLGDEYSTLYRGDSQIGFFDQSVVSGVGPATYPFTGFGTVAGDLNLDGYLDLVVVNGAVRRRAEIFLPGEETSDGKFWSAYAEPDQLLLNDGNGMFVDASSEPSWAALGVRVSRGLACGDLDRDGDLDMVATAIGFPARLLINETPTSGHWLSVRAVEPQWGGRDAVGSVVTVTSGSRVLSRRVTRAGSYLSSHDARTHFGLGDTNQIDSLSVVWSDGSEERFPIQAVNQHLTLRHGDGIDE